MGQRPNITTNFLFDRKWETSIRRLKPKEFHKLFWELYDFQMSGGRIKVPNYEDNPLIGTVVSFVVPQIQNRIDASGFFPHQAKGGTPFEKAYGPAVGNTSSKGRGTAGGATGGAAGGAAGGATGGATPKLSQDKISQDKLTLSQVESKPTKEDGGTALGGGSPPDTPSPKENEEKEFSEKHGDGGIAAEGDPPSAALRPQTGDGRKQAYGTHKNVWMTPEGYQLVTQGMGIPEAYINHFSEKLQSHSYQYPDHAAALTAWWAEEKNKLFWKHASATHEKQAPPQKTKPSTSATGNGSFDTEDFFELAVRKSFGEEA